VVENFDATSDEVEMPVGNGIERAGIDGYDFWHFAVSLRADILSRNVTELRDGAGIPRVAGRVESGWSVVTVQVLEDAVQGGFDDRLPELI
jgi:hypothetical protein